MKQHSSTQLSPPRPALALPVEIEAGFRAALAEAFSHAGATAPNPAVGCALLDHEGQLLCCEAHHHAGGPHAEANAIARARALNVLERAHTAVVTLEPCNHHGRTGPCTHALLATPVREIWVGVPDPNPVVQGGGAAMLQAAGRKVVMLQSCAGPAAAELLALCRGLVAPFARSRLQHRPWITVKQALDAQGTMVPPPGQKTFTSRSSLVLAHRLRRATEAIITGANTIVMDEPGFDVRHVPDHAALPRGGRVIMVCDRAGRLPPSWVERAQARGLRVRTCRDIKSAPEMLYHEGVMWAMVEGGPNLLRAVEECGLWDDWLTIRANGAGARGGDEISIRARGSVTPLGLFFNTVRKG